MTEPTDTSTAPATEQGVQAEEWKPKILAFCCNWCTYAGADLAGLNRMSYPADIRLLRVPCSGRVNPQYILKAYQNGCDGVLVCGCHPGDCHYSWLVDPDGRLFFSHGVDCVRVGAETGVGFRERYFEWIPEKTDPVFGGFLGTVRWPAAHGFYKQPEHLPYATFSFGRANARRMDGFRYEKFIKIVAAHSAIGGKIESEFSCITRRTLIIEAHPIFIICAEFFIIPRAGTIHSNTAIVSALHCEASIMTEEKRL